MIRLALLTKSDDTELYGDREPLLGALDGEGIEAVPVPWGVAEVEQFPAALVRTTWDYVERYDEFLAWIDDVATRLPVANAAPIIRWNTDKRYLRDLARAGVPVVETMWLEPGGVVPDVAPGRVVVKPAISAGGRRSASYPAFDDDAAAHARSIAASGVTAMIQPHVESIDTHGEIGVYVFGGDVTHAVHKGGILVTGAAPVDDNSLAVDQFSERADVSDELASFARRVVGAVPRRLGEPLYARVDVVRGDDGALRLLEAELVEPYLFLEHTPEAAAPVARAIAAWVRRVAAP